MGRVYSATGLSYPQTTEQASMLNYSRVGDKINGKRIPGGSRKEFLPENNAADGDQGCASLIGRALHVARGLPCGTIEVTKGQVDGG